MTSSSAADLLRSLRRAGVQIGLSGDRIQVSAPAGVLTSALQAEMRERRDELIDLLAAERAQRETTVEAQLVGDAPVRLAPGQSRLWLFQQLDPASPAYNLTPAVQIEGPLDAGRLELALAAVLERHEPLRSVVDSTDPVGFIKPLPVSLPLLRVVDLSGLPAEEQTREAVAQVQDDQRKPFDLARDIPFRATLLRFAPNVHQVVTTIHHIAVDGASLQHFYRDLAAYYDGQTLPPLRATYREYAAWEQSYWNADRLAQRTEFWRRTMEGVPPVLDLPTDRPRSASPSYEGSIVTHVVRGRDYDGVRQLMQEEGASLFMVLLGVLGAALHRHSGQRDLVIGTPLHGRDRPEYSDLVGMFVNQLPLRVQVPAAATLRDLVRDARSTALATLTEHELPFGAIVDAVGVPRDNTRNPLFQVLLNVLPPTRLDGGISAGDVTFVLPETQEVLALFDGQSRFDMTLYVTQREGEIHLSLVYNRDLFLPDRAAALLDTIAQILRVAATPDASLDAVLAPSQGGVAVVADVAAGDETVVDRIRSIASRTPQAAAFSDEQGTLTYAQLLTEVDRVARSVALVTADASTPVGVMVPHDRNAAVAILGVLASGRPYVPLDPRYPLERLRLMAEDAHLSAILATPDHRELADAVRPPEAVVLDASAVVEGGEDRVSPPRPDGVAYLLYTSGSTGRPKAVMQSHRNLLVQAERYATMLAIEPADRVSLLASISFDASLMDLFGGLLSGACVHAIDPHSTDLSLLPEIVRERGISTLHVTPTVFRSLIRTTRGGSWSSIRVVVLGGEPVRADDVAEFAEAFPPAARLLNLYGASEHSFSIGQFLPRDHRSLEVPIGFPLGDVEIVLLDQEGREDGVIGEMAVRSAYNAIGYHAQPERTAAAFIVEPGAEGRTLYRTGDLARRRPDGRYVVYGRVDGQVKVRGHRIELSEVESVLRQHPSVQDAGVHAPREANGEQSLVACYTLHPGATVSAADLAAWCGRWLPRYMVPGAWLVVDGLPRTPSGKVDRRSLPTPGKGQHGDGRKVDVHRADAEEQLIQEIWHEVLGLEEPGLHDDFFLVGGNSLNATQVVARIRDVLGVQVPLRQFFDVPTIEGTARWIRENRAGAITPPRLEPRRPLPEPMPLSFSQERMWLLKQLATDSSAYNMYAGARLRGALDVERLRSAIDQVMERQISLRTVFPSLHGRPTQRILPAACDFCFERIEGLDAEDALTEASRRAVERMEANYDLETGPLFRAYLAELGDGDHLLAVGMHHIVSDMWSFAIFGMELAAFYGGRGDSLPPLDVAYADYTLWQREWLEAGTLELQLEHWRDQLRGLQPLDLAVDKVRPPFYSYDGDTIILEVSDELRAGIEAVSAKARATPFMTTLAAFNALLAAHSGQTDIAVGVPIANRTQSATENLIGTFVNTLVHRNQVEPGTSFPDLLDGVRRTALDAFAHQDVPFELLVKELQPARDTSRPPLVQVLFNVANIGTEGVELPGLQQEVVSLERKSAQFELVLNVAINAHQSHLQLTYNTALFNRVTAERLLRHYHEILERIVSDPGISLAELQRVSAEERSLLLDEWNDTGRLFDLETNLPLLVQATAARRHDEVAVQSPTGAYTYGELLDYAGRVTCALQSMGVQRGDRVAIVMQRSREMLGALIGILGAGAAYVPVDPNYPPNRVAYMLEDSAAAAIVTHRGLERDYPSACPVLDLDRWTAPPPAPFVATDPSDAAYVIYTSGSTGKPKGVEISHGAMVNFLRSMADEPGFTSADRLLAVTTISFDISVLELYLPLLTGGQVVIASEDDVLDGRRLLNRIDEEKITVMQATPATWKLMLAAGWQGTPGLRVLCGGEPLPEKLAEELLSRVSDLWNMYGPTETTVWSTVERIEQSSSILVGRPIANTTLYVLDDALQPRPVGVPGELYIGGAGVANGYVNRPELTAERFIDSPFRPGERIYRTGDLVRYRGDGRVEHLGRLDNQVKVRGFRIELGEVEAALQSHPAVRDAVVIASGDRLVGYVVSEPGREPTTTELRGWVSASLPPYMVPALTMNLDELPLTPNGKVDRKQLPEPVGAAPEPLRAQAQTLTDAERVVAEVWQSLLGVDAVGPKDNFFELGGHSLLAVEAVALIEERTGYRPEPRSLFFMSLGEIAASIPEATTSV